MPKGWPRFAPPRDPRAVPCAPQRAPAAAPLALAVCPRRLRLFCCFCLAYMFMFVVLCLLFCFSCSPRSLTPMRWVGDLGRKDALNAN